ncbi:PREDICTED: methylmalonic aciduria and homocystinuria type C protein homolog [Priapulus caudatus]|uniref:Cyanocobalamin reductase (cyanide-eliminating) n=1 Tax=Priapulus caudatus TaxID=37621 RepID=A0ABM1E563_PRICU|nr:PREDICTED: methylmalonic aciduria and homocystinuria type C protein homolog [Priapulus caudatus]
MTTHTIIDNNDALSINKGIRELLEHAGFESYPFKVSWYNKSVEPVFHLGYHGDTLAFIIISTPNMYENAFKPFVTRSKCLGVRDPIDECVAHHFDQVKNLFSGEKITCIHDFELTPTRRPKILVQTASHIAGAAYYYQRNDVKEQPTRWDKKSRIYGVCIHPKWGGWFGLRGVLIFDNVQCPELSQTIPPDVVDTDAKKIELLERFNNNWQDWTFRDIIPPDGRYSEEQKLYFATAPAERKKLLGIEELS